MIFLWVSFPTEYPIYLTFARIPPLPGAVFKAFLFFILKELLIYYELYLWSISWKSSFIATSANLMREVMLSLSRIEECNYMNSAQFKMILTTCFICFKPLLSPYSTYGKKNWKRSWLILLSMMAWHAIFFFWTDSLWRILKLKQRDSLIPEILFSS